MLNFFAVKVKNPFISLSYKESLSEYDYFCLEKILLCEKYCLPVFCFGLAFPLLLPDRLVRMRKWGKCPEPLLTLLPSIA